MYPNPVNDQLFIKSEVALSKLTILDISGKKLLEKKLNQQFNSTTNLDQLSSGLYFIKLQTENSSIVKRIIKK